MTLDLLENLRIVDDDVTAVVNAYLADPSCGKVRFDEGYRIDPALAVAEHPFADTLMRQPWAREELWWAAVRAAVMLSVPERDRSPISFDLHQSRHRTVYPVAQYVTGTTNASRQSYFRTS